MWSKHSRLFYAARGIFSGNLGCIFKTFNIALLSFNKSGGNPAKITLEPDLGRIRKNDQILAGAGFGAEFRYSPTIYVSPGKKVSVFSSVQLCILHRKNVARSQA